jgi:hypothetical protein
MARSTWSFVVCALVLCGASVPVLADDGSPPAAPSAQPTTNAPPTTPTTPPPTPAPIPTSPAPTTTPAPPPSPAPAPTTTPGTNPGPTATQPTVLGGRVTDVLGKPIVKARVYVLPRGGGRIQSETDTDGRYTLELGAGGAYSVVIAIGRVHTYRQVLVTEHASTKLDVEVETDIAGGEVIKIVDTKLPPPAVPPKPENEYSRKSLPYSPQAMERDAWARAFLLLDINEHGEVTRLKLLKRPGYDLDQIAIDEAFKLKFEPARDAAGRPVRTYIVWDMEWPSWGWLVQGNGTTAGRPVTYDDMYRYNRLETRVHRDGQAAAPNDHVGQAEEFAGSGDPNERNIRNQTRAANVNRYSAQPLPVTGPQPLSRVPCAGSGPLNLDLQNRAYRDCSRPDMSSVDALPWITRQNAKTALAALDSNKPQIVPGPRRSRLPALIATGVTSALAIGLVASYVQYDKYSSRRFDQSIATLELLEERQRNLAHVETWNHRMFAFAGAVVVSGGVTAFLWGRSQTRESFSVQPAKGGGAVSYGRSF